MVELQNNRASVVHIVFKPTNLTSFLFNSFQLLSFYIFFFFLSFLSSSLTLQWLGTPKGLSPQYRNNSVFSEHHHFLAHCYFLDTSSHHSPASSTDGKLPQSICAWVSRRLGSAPMCQGLYRHDSS